MKKFVYICSPCRGDYKANIERAKGYCREVTLRCDAIPIAPHVYFTQFLDDTKPDERKLGLHAGIELLEMCDELWIFANGEPSEGMKDEIEFAHRDGIPVIDGFKALQNGRTE